MLLREGRDYWRKERADRLAFLIDAAPYFGAVRAAMRLAERSIRIVGWDIHSRMRLVGPEGEPDDGLPAELGPFLNALLKQRRKLRVHILTWDFAMIYAIEREVLPLLNREWTAHRRMHFRLDSAHPLGASQHQKIVVIDDVLAFVGGIDLTMRRWDTPEHRPLDPRRLDPNGTPYAPFHDAAAMLDGPAARALSELVRERWFRATGRMAKPVPAPPRVPWPATIRPDLRAVGVAISRTDPAFGGRPDVREAESLWLTAIAGAERFIYIENQYLTATSVTEAIAARLDEPEGPDIVLVLPQRAHGWLEANALGDAQARLMRRLREVDRYGRLRLFYPVLAGDAPAEERWVRVHGKVLVVEDRLARVGSSNLSNRSMGVDTECDIAVEAADGDLATRAAIAGLRNRLLAEHLGCSPDTVAQAIASCRRPIEAIDRLAAEGNGRGFRPVDEVLPPMPTPLDDVADIDAIEANPFDPERPLQPDRFLDDFLPEVPPRHRLSRRVALSIAYIVVVFAALGLWAFSPLRHHLTLDAMLAEIDRLNGNPWAPAYVLASFVGASMVMLPVVLLIAVCAVAFGPLLGVGYALGGAVASATIVFFLGRLIGRDIVRRLAGRRLNRLSLRLARSGILTVAALRMLPIAPFTLVNLVAGAMRLRYRDFLCGTVLGMLPGIAAMTVLGATVERVLRTRDPGSIIVLALVLGFLAAVGLAIQRWLGRGGGRAAPPTRPRRLRGRRHRPVPAPGE